LELGGFVVEFLEFLLESGEFAPAGEGVAFDSQVDGNGDLLVTLEKQPDRSELAGR
jgi:hypothetical protein